MFQVVNFQQYESLWEYNTNNFECFQLMIFKSMSTNMHCNTSEALPPFSATISTFFVHKLFVLSSTLIIRQKI